MSVCNVGICVGDREMWAFVHVWERERCGLCCVGQRERCGHLCVGERGREHTIFNMILKTIFHQSLLQLFILHYISTPVNTG